MTVYIDDMFRWPMGKYGRLKMSHMITDTDEELHAMAAKIGVARRWCQGDHYDVCMSMRALAIGHGAVAISMRELSRIAMQKRREAARAIEAEKAREGRT